MRNGNPFAARRMFVFSLNFLPAFWEICFSRCCWFLFWFCVVGLFFFLDENAFFCVCNDLPGVVILQKVKKPVTSQSQFDERWHWNPWLSLWCSRPFLIGCFHACQSTALKALEYLTFWELSSYHCMPVRPKYLWVYRQTLTAGVSWVAVAVLLHQCCAANRLQM